MASYVWSALSNLDQAVQKAVVGWSANDIPDLHGKVAMVTGGNSGLGLQLVRKLAENGAEVYMVSRVLKNGQKVVSEIAADLGEKVAQRISVLECDLSTLANVGDLSRRFRALGKPLHLLVLDAGIFHPGPFTRTEDGIELSLAVNHFSHVRLASNLLDIIEASGTASSRSRIVFMASVGEMFGTVDFEDFTGSNYRTSGLMPYSNAKLYGLMWGRELQDRLRAAGAHVDVFGTHPGGVDTPLFDLNKIDLRYWTASLIFASVKVAGLPVKTGATSLLYAATEPALQGKGFQYIGPQYLLQSFHTHHFTPWNSAFKKPALRRRVYEKTMDVLRSVAGPPLAPNADQLM